MRVTPPDLTLGFNTCFSWCLRGPSSSPHTELCGHPEPQRKPLNCDRECLQTGDPQVVVISIKEETEMCFEGFIPFSVKAWADFKKCWHGIKARERPTRGDGQNAYSEQSERLTTELCWLFSTTQNIQWGHLTYLLSSGTSWTSVHKCVCQERENSLSFRAQTLMTLSGVHLLKKRV